MENTTGTVVSVVTNEHEGVYMDESHMPFPNTTVVSGIGIKWPHTKQGAALTLGRRAVVLGAYFTFNRVHELPRAAIEYAIVDTPPLCLYRHALWGGRVIISAAIFRKMAGQVGISPSI